jgi:GNAT superfamily N-acetyltransferase
VNPAQLEYLGAMTRGTQVGEVIELLRSDPLRHIDTLKVLSAYPNAAQLRLSREGSAWALSAVCPVSAFAGDQRAYPGAEFVVLVDGNSAWLMRQLLPDLPKTELVLKTADATLAGDAVALYRGRSLRVLLSFTGEESCPGGNDRLAAPTTGDTLDQELAEVLSSFGNDLKYLDRCFRQGARWFAFRGAGKVHSGCVVYQNFESIWEIAGVFTQPKWRRQGLGRRVVAAAVQYLRTEQRRPRYQVDAQNLPSIELARGLGLVPFLRVEHVLVPAQVR